MVIAESFEHIHRSNLVGFGVLPLKFKTGENTKRLGLCGEEVFAIGSLGERAGGRRRESGYRCRRGH
ncbi:MAG: hypothetical protein L0H63_12580 [Nitrococcus sp.]|nr:hypothetical protein [Nitrococcus sp.]